MADAKAWDRPLDQTVAAGTKKGQVLSENPSLQIYIYVQHSGLAWGILTNGRLWRLVHRDTAEIIRLETELNRRVYALFDVIPAEIELIEASTKYRYGEV